MTDYIEGDAPRQQITKLEQLQRGFERSLAIGPAHIPEQIRYILAISQSARKTPLSQPQPESPLSVVDARLSALVELSPTLSQKQRRTLLRDIQKLDDDVRLPLILKLAKNNPLEYRGLVQHVWADVQKLHNAALRSQILFMLVPLLEETPQLDNEPTQPTRYLTEAINLTEQFDSSAAQVRSQVAIAPHLPLTMCNRLLNRLLDKVDNSGSDSLRANAIIAVSDRFGPAIEKRVLDSVKLIRDANDRVRALTALARNISSQQQVMIRREGLKAISEIRNEDNRAEWLISFAPYLESASEETGFPELLGQALAIAISLTKRHIRARALVALAPHLTPDLQGEALAAVHSLGNERERANLLAELAPTLPPDMLVASLALAHTMREQDTRVHALTVLAQNTPQHVRSQALLDALASAANLPHRYERVMALVELIDVLPPNLQDQALANALETTRLIENENARARALSLLGSYLPMSLLNQALETIYQLEDPEQRLNALGGVVARMTDNDRNSILINMLECVREMPLEYKQARALASIAPHLTPDLIYDALNMTDHLEDAFDRVSAYNALAQNLPPEQRSEIIKKAWALILFIDNGYDRSSAIAAIAPYLPEQAKHNLGRVAVDVIRGIEDEYDRASAITILAPLLIYGPKTQTSPMLDHYAVIKQGILVALEISQQSVMTQRMIEGAALWMELPIAQSYALWEEVAVGLAALPLADALLCLGTLIPIFETLIDKDGLKEIAHILGVR